MMNIYKILNSNWHFLNRFKIPTADFLQKLVIKRNQRSMNPYDTVRPVSVTIENTTICNSRCFFCPHGSGIFTRKKEIMDHKLFSKIIGICKKESIKSIMFSGLGEPLCDKEFIRKASLVVKEGLILNSLTSNGMLLSKEIGKTLIDLNLNRLNLSIDSLIPDEYERIRKGLSFKRVVSNIIDFLEMNIKAGGKVHVTINAISEIGYNEKETDYLEMFQKYLGSNFRITFYPTHNWTGFLSQYGSSKHRNPHLIINTVCRRVFEPEVQIRVDGSLALCCMDYDNKYSLGTIDQSILEKWNSKKIIHARKMHVGGKWGGLEICRSCSDKIMGRPPIREIR